MEKAGMIDLVPPEDLSCQQGPPLPVSIEAVPFVKAALSSADDVLSYSAEGSAGLSMAFGPWMPC